MVCFAAIPLAVVAALASFAAASHHCTHTIENCGHDLLNLGKFV